MFIKKSSEFDSNLVDSYASILKKANDEEAAAAIVGAAEVEAKEECEDGVDEYKDKETEKLQKVVTLLSDACSALEDDEKYKKVCKKIVKAIKLIDKITGSEAKEINSSEDVEKEVQEEIEEQEAE